MKLYLADNGMGFKQEYAEQIFGLFKRFNNKVEFPAQELVYHLCRKVVANHNGKIVAKQQ